MSSTTDCNSGCHYCKQPTTEPGDHAGPTHEFGDNALMCTVCKHKTHIKCLRTSPPSSLHNDYLYNFTCEACSSTGEELFERPQKIQWVYVVALLLHHLQTTERGRYGYFHYKKDISALFSKHCAHILPHTTSNVSKISNNIAGALSNYSGDVFLSSIAELSEIGWWKLVDNSPPLLGKVYKRLDPALSSLSMRPASSTRTRKRKELSDDFLPGPIKKGKKSQAKTPPSAKKKSVKEVKPETAIRFETEIVNENAEPFISPAPIPKLSSELLDKNTSSMDEIDYSSLHPLDIRLQEDLFDFLISSDPTANRTDTETGIDYDMLTDGNPLNSLDLLNVVPEDLQVPEPENNNVEPVTTSWDYSNFSENSNVAKVEQNEVEPSIPTADPKMKQKTPEKSKGSDEESESDNETEPSASRPVTPMEETVENKPYTLMNDYQRDMLLMRLDKIFEGVSAKHKLNTRLAMIRRTLHLRKLKETRRLPVVLLREHTNVSTEENNDSKPASRHKNCILDRYCGITDGSFVKAGGFVPFVERIHRQRHRPKLMTSSYTSRLLKPYIWRDWEAKPLKLALFQELGTHTLIHCPPADPLEASSIDYCYVQKQHIGIINNICHTVFWPGIDLTECLQYPDFSCVVLYKKLVIGFAFMVPDASYNMAYISFIYTHPEWRRAGIASFMLYHLIQTCMGKDVSLHVSVTNPALSLYFKFGFRIKEMIHNFYDKYLPVNCSDSKHAFFLELQRY